MRDEEVDRELGRGQKERRVVRFGSRRNTEA